jgi:DNA helicase-2/ATP-dependent DNA helicase PcrA
LKRLGVPHARVAVDTIAGWSMRYAHAFPGVAQPPAGVPQGAQWDQLYSGATLALGVDAVKQVVAASYDRILIDEYQDCNYLQHDLAIGLSAIVPTLIFGDPMQGIFEFSGATLSWDDEIHPTFPFSGTLNTPHRWNAKNPELGHWIAETREKLIQGRPIDLSDSRITYRQSNNAFDMATLFDGIDGKEGNFAAIHCRKGICYQLARASGGGYQAIEEIAAGRLHQFAQAWDGANDVSSRHRAITTLMQDCFNERQAQAADPEDPEDTEVTATLRGLLPALVTGNGAEAAAQILALSRKRPRWRLFRSELWRDAERAIAELAANRAENMAAASGRKLPKRTVSTPLLLKGLEFDHVIIPDATHFANEQSAQAKLFYVAISRATQSLTISSSQRIISFPIPNS